MHSIFGLVASGDLGLRRYGDVFESASNSTFDSAMLKDLSSRMAPAAEEMRRLDQLITMAEVRYSGMLYGIVQLLLLWDQNVMVSLEKWRRSSGANVDGWISALGELEAIAALAGMSHAHPDWVFPEIYEHEEAPIMDAKEVGHPLIPPEKCIVNDIRLGPPGTFLFVTGSNMSGKSTLLRSIGVNTTLALAGGPVFASKMRLPTASLLTSMRVTDSLEQGISQYMAQLERLKMVVDGCEAGRNNESGPRALFLLDEILQGTNSSERLVAVRRIVQRLIETGAIGAVTSHELTVPEVPILSEAAQIVHFRETATRDSDGVSLSFDYKLRQGLSTTTNALKLMELIGLD